MDEIERWVRSWGDGSSCSTRNQFEFSKDLLLKELQKNKAIRTGLGDKDENADKISQWINNHILPQEQNFAFHYKARKRCFHEYVTNATEGLNYAAKHSSMSAKPNHSLKTAAAAMNSHKHMKNMDRQHEKLQRSNSTPLYVDGQTTVHNMDCLTKLVPIARHMLIEQMRHGQSHYMALQLTPTSFAVIRETAPDTGPLLGCPESFKGRPKFRTANIVTKQDSTSGNPPILVCSCGLKAQNGIICRHLFALQTDYDIHDIACRWHTSYNLHAYEEGQGPITSAYEKLQQQEHAGVTFKRICSTYNDQDLTTTDGVYPRMIVAGTKMLSIKDAMAIVESSVPICWNYEFAEYPDSLTLNEIEGGVPTQFTQESAILETEFDGFPSEDCIDASQELAWNAEEVMRVQPRHNIHKARAMMQQKWK